MTTLAIDPKRSLVKAREIPDWPEPCDEQARFFGEPGDIIRSFRTDGSLYGFLVACPSCGQFGEVSLYCRSGVNWTVTEGSEADVTGMTLHPSIEKHCCGWHGHLVRGVFVAC